MALIFAYPNEKRMASQLNCPYFGTSKVYPTRYKSISEKRGCSSNHLAKFTKSSIVLSTTNILLKKALVELHLYKEQSIDMPNFRSTRNFMCGSRQGNVYCSFRTNFIANKSRVKNRFKDSRKASLFVALLKISQFQIHNALSLLLSSSNAFLCILQPPWPSRSFKQIDISKR